MARPKSDDPVTQKNIYPRRSVWDRLVVLAENNRRKPAEYAVMLIEQALELEEK